MLLVLVFSFFVLVVVLVFAVVVFAVFVVIVSTRTSIDTCLHDSVLLPRSGQSFVFSFFRLLTFVWLQETTIVTRPTGARLCRSAVWYAFIYTYLMLLKAVCSPRPSRLRCCKLCLHPPPHPLVWQRFFLSLFLSLSLSRSPLFLSLFVCLSLSISLSDSSLWSIPPIHLSPPQPTTRRGPSRFPFFRKGCTMRCSLCARS